MKKQTLKCLQCGEALNGRIDQKFCTPYCKSAYHYEQNKQNDISQFKTIDVQLKFNRRILKRYTQSGQSQIKKELLVSDGFDFKYFTHYWKAKNGNVYFFCYEYGYRDLKDGKYMLITLQEYMV